MFLISCRFFEILTKSYDGALWRVGASSDAESWIRPCSQFENVNIIQRTKPKLHLLQCINSNKHQDLNQNLIRIIAVHTKFMAKLMLIIQRFFPVKMASVIVFTIGLMDTRSLLILVMAWSVLILLECVLVAHIVIFYNYCSFFTHVVAFSWLKNIIF